MHNIPKNIFMVWFGDVLPLYINNTLSEYRRINPEFNVKLVWYKFDQFKDALDKKNILNEYDEILYDTANKILHDDFYTDLKKDLFLRNAFIEIDFCWILADVFRLALLNKFGGIYVDCDTFPIKPFDDKLLNYGNFCIMNTKRFPYAFLLDNYFIGANGKDKMQNYFNFKKLIQNRYADEDKMQFMFRRTLFMKGKLNSSHFQKCCNNDIYIEHYDAGLNKQLKNGFY